MHMREEVAVPATPEASEDSADFLAEITPSASGQPQDTTAGSSSIPSLSAASGCLKA